MEVRATHHNIGGCDVARGGGKLIHGDRAALTAARTDALGEHARGCRASRLDDARVGHEYGAAITHGGAIVGAATAVGAAAQIDVRVDLAALEIGGCRAG